VFWQAYKKRRNTEYTVERTVIVTNSGNALLTLAGAPLVASPGDRPTIA